MTTPRQLHERPFLRDGGVAVSLAPRRGRSRRRVLALGALLALAGLGLRGAGSADEDAPTADPPAPPTATLAARDGLGPLEEPSEPAPPPTPPFAEIAGTTLLAPSSDVLLVGYHEASRAGALGLTPVGQGRSNDNTTRFTLPPDDATGTPYHVMSSRGRVLPPTSAVDIVLRDDDPVRSPVDGVVTEVRPYALYGTHPDTRVEIRPDDARHLRLVMIHVDDVQVARGDRVTAGETVLAGTANRFPFASHVDRYLDERWPHVHVEVKDPSQADAGG
jgi:hypothetical protein